MKQYNYKACGFVSGQGGDSVMMTPLIRQFKKDNPNCHFTFCLSKKYEQFLHLFRYHPDIDNCHIWDSYEDWPNQKDLEFIQKGRFNIIYGGMPLHTEDFWYLKHHYVKEFGLMYNINVEDLQCELSPWFYSLWGHNYNDIITCSLHPSMDVGQKKSLSINQIERLAIELNKMGYRLVELGGKYSPEIKNVEKPDLSIIGSSHALYSSRLHLTCDTSFGWISSAYKHSTIGFYTNNLPYMTAETCKNIQPINPNAYYFHRDNLEDLKIEEIIEKIKEML